ncbi:MAG: hypothetical protein AB8B73_11595 [Ekhidna sp.]
MKRTIFIAFLFALSFSSIAQFNFTIGLGASFYEGEAAPMLDFQPKFQIADDIRVGLVGKIGLGDYFNSFYADINVKPINKTSFYFGFGAGWTSFRTVQTGTTINPFNVELEPEYATSFIPSIGFQDAVDLNFSAYIGFGRIEYYSLTLSWVIGYKEDE